MRNLPPKRSWFGALLLSSGALHGVLLWTLAGTATDRIAPKPEPVRISVRSVPVPPAPTAMNEPVAVPAAPQPPAVTQRKTARKAPLAGATEPAPAQVSRPLDATPAPSEPLDFTGVTLTSTSGAASWTSISGNGQASNGPLAAPPRGTRTGAAGQGDQAGQGGSSRMPVVGLASLSRPPVAPSLDDELVSNYPPAAREQGVPGRAVVRARILPNGRVAQTEVLVASAPEFGRACQRTLSSSRWSAPLDQSGRPVATDISYTCQFEVTR